MTFNSSMNPGTKPMINGYRGKSFRCRVSTGEVLDVVRFGWGKWFNKWGNESMAMLAVDKDDQFHLLFQEGDSWKSIFVCRKLEEVEHWIKLFVSLHLALEESVRHAIKAHGTRKPGRPKKVQVVQ